VSLSIRCLARASLLAALVAQVRVQALHAQKTVIGLTGSIYRYHGDTIWMEKDSTVIRSITSGDTVANRTEVNDRLMYEMVTVVHGDSARVIQMTRRDGTAAPMPAEGMSVPVAAVTFLQSALQMESRSASIGAGRALERMTPPASPDPAREYVVSPASRIAQHRDTVWVIRGCPAERRDTTTFLLFGTDSTRRLTPPQRTFGQGMVQSLLGEMRSALIRDMVSSTSMFTPPPDLPKAPPTCR
jgi:hypothetical protein